MCHLNKKKKKKAKSGKLVKMQSFYLVCIVFPKNIWYTTWALVGLLFYTSQWVKKKALILVQETHKHLWHYILLAKTSILTNVHCKPCRFSLWSIQPYNISLYRSDAGLKGVPILSTCRTHPDCYQYWCYNNVNVSDFNMMKVEFKNQI